MTNETGWFEKHVHPDCCMDMRRHKSVYLVCPHEKFVNGEECTPTWMTKGLFHFPDQEVEIKTKDGIKLKKFPGHKMVDSVPAAFCPFCGSPVPEIELRETKAKIMTCSDGGYYCDTCNQRGGECQCKPPEYRWKPTKNK